MKKKIESLNHSNNKGVMFPFKDIKYVEGRSNQNNKNNNNNNNNNSKIPNENIKKALEYYNMVHK